MSTTHTKAFLVVNASGEEIQEFDFPEDATRAMRDIPSAAEVLRRSDGAQLAYRGKETMLSSFRGAA